MPPLAHSRVAGPDTRNSQQVSHYLSVSHLSQDQLLAILERAKAIKRESSNGHFGPPLLAGKTAALLFQKPSLRTRASFEVAMLQLGGSAIYLSPGEIQLGQREGIPDAARVLSRYVQAIVARVFLHSDVEELSRYSTVPVINALSDLEHPCQILADLLTIQERCGRLRDVVVAYIGDGNNVANSLASAAMLVGMHLRVASPDGYEPDGSILARSGTDRGSGSIELIRDPRLAVRNADVIYTDAWYSMGQEDEAETRLPLFQPYQVNDALLGHAPSDAVVMHCLPAHRGQEITDSVMDGPRSAVFDQAENRLHAQKALLIHLLTG